MKFSRVKKVVWEPQEGSQELFLSCPAFECLLHGNRGGGKAQPLWSKVLTPKGWVCMGDIKVGDSLLVPKTDGSLGYDKECVEGVFPQGTKSIYRLQFADRSVVFASRDHLWIYKTKFSVSFFDEDYKIGTTEQLQNLLNYSIVMVPSIGASDGCVSKRLTSVEFYGKYPCQCIKVSGGNGLYITDNFIVTHNTDSLLMDFLQGVGRGYGAEYRGLLLREATTELGDIIAKCKKWIPQIFPTAKYNASKKIWTFQDGETLWLNYARVEEDYWQYHGHSYAWIGWEELTNWPTPDIYLKLMSCSRTTHPKIRLKYRATTNPYGPGHAWVKSRFIDLIQEGKIYRDEFGQTRTHLSSSLFENKILLKSDPTYPEKLLSMTEGNKVLRDAWVYGSWNLMIGGFFSDVWDAKIHIIKPFKPPKSWTGIRSFDWGSSRPWSVSYLWETNGEQPNKKYNVPYLPPGSVIVPSELYGWNGMPNEGDRATSPEIAEKVLQMDEQLRKKYGVKIFPGPADTSIWEVRDGSSIAIRMANEGCRWTKAYKGSGSRISGWAIIRQMLKAAKKKDLERPHLYFFPDAVHHIRTLPLLQRDKVKPEDVDTTGEDHAADSLRYGLSRKMIKMKRKKVGY